MGTVAELETPPNENSLVKGLTEVAEEVGDRASSMVKRFARPAAASLEPVSGEQLGAEFAKTYTAALQAFKENSPSATETEQAHASRELAGLAADATRRNLELTAGREAEPVKTGGLSIAA